ncbi:DUF2127 domain-containing protein [Candidatus Saccharibacteria bacterium]|nr:DUF2127 domain-containing protein [Candidatus Saccharibacteria bacterium]
MALSNSEKTLNQAFGASLVMKALDAVFEIVAGVLLLQSPSPISNFIPDTNASLEVLIVYFILHGSFKLVLVVALYRKKTWAFPLMIGFLVVFMVYQIYRMFVEPSSWLVALIILDAGFIWITKIQYKLTRKLLAAKARDPDVTAKIAS